MLFCFSLVFCYFILSLCILATPLWMSMVWLAKEKPERDSRVGLLRVVNNVRTKIRLADYVYVSDLRGYVGR
jgi:hypothetical protein